MRNVERKKEIEIAGELGDLVTSWIELDRLVGGLCLQERTDRCSLFFSPG